MCAGGGASTHCYLRRLLYGRATGAGGVNPRKRQKGLAKRICSGVRQSDVRRTGLATIAATQRAREVATLRRWQAVVELHAPRCFARRSRWPWSRRHRCFLPLKLVDGAPTRAPSGSLARRATTCAL